MIPILYRITVEADEYFSNESRFGFFFPPVTQKENDDDFCKSSLLLFTLILKFFLRVICKQKVAFFRVGGASPV